MDVAKLVLEPRSSGDRAGREGAIRARLEQITPGARISFESKDDHPHLRHEVESQFEARRSGRLSEQRENRETQDTLSWLKKVDA